MKSPKSTWCDHLVDWDLIANALEPGEGKEFWRCTRCAMTWPVSEERGAC